MDKLWERILNQIDQNQLFGLLGKTIFSLVLLVVFLVVGRLVRTMVRRLTSRTSRNANLPILLGNLAYVTLLVLGALSILSVYTGSGLTNLITLLGLVSLAISLSVQDVLKNFVSGVYLLLEQPFSIGDRIKVREVEGKVDNIEIRTTTINTDEGVLVYIPNSIVFSEVVTNRTAYHHRLSTIAFSIPSENISFTEICDKIKALLVGFEDAKVSKDPEPQILVEAVNATKTTAKIQFWSPITAPASTPSEVMLALNKALPEGEFSWAGSGTPVVVAK